MAINEVKVFHIDNINDITSWLNDNKITVNCFLCDDIRQRKVGYKLVFNKKNDLEKFKQAWF